MCVIGCRNVMGDHFDEVVGMYWHKLQHLTTTTEGSGKAGHALLAVRQSQQQAAVSCVPTCSAGACTHSHASEAR